MIKKIDEVVQTPFTSGYHNAIGFNGLTYNDCMSIWGSESNFINIIIEELIRRYEGYYVSVNEVTKIISILTSDTNISSKMTSRDFKFINYATPYEYVSSGVILYFDKVVVSESYKTLHWNRKIGEVQHVFNVNIFPNGDLIGNSRNTTINIHSVTYELHGFKRIYLQNILKLFYEVSKSSKLQQIMSTTNKYGYRKEIIEKSESESSKNGDETTNLDIVNETESEGASTPSYNGSLNNFIDEKGKASVRGTTEGKTSKTENSDSIQETTNDEVMDDYTMRNTMILNMLQMDNTFYNAYNDFINSFKPLLLPLMDDDFDER